MIGVIADSGDREAVREFFELFKTPWEFYRTGRRYDAVLCSGDREVAGGAKLVLLYSGRKARADEGRKVHGRDSRGASVLVRPGLRLPVYGEAVTFPEVADGLLAEESSGESAAYMERSGETAFARIGYDLFAEVRTLLTEGQPEEHAGLPALELHIEFLRSTITACGIPLAEIPPVPDGYRFIACLTHDVDHPSIRAHRWDHTTLGFLYRAVIGSFRDMLRGRQGLRGLFRNWAAAMKLPLVHLRLAKDFWLDFGDGYLEIEKGLPSTFFVIPFKDRAGQRQDGPAPAFRGAKYGAAEIAATLRKLQDAGCEVALHGIDAWLDSSRGMEEIAEIQRLTGAPATGVRMHWLYFDRQSPRVLEQAGAAYDSTVGYNGTVGYRAGTTQVYRPLAGNRLPELPLHAMDTALFYPAHLGLSQSEGRAILSRMVDRAVRFGGCLTVNWHDRSIAPERLWDGCYRSLLEELKSRGAWFATAGQAVSWFERRRSASFEKDPKRPEAVCVRVEPGRSDLLPGLRLRTYHPGAEEYVDTAFAESVEMAAPSGAGK